MKEDYKLKRHQVEFDEIRRCCLLCHGLDYTSTLLYSPDFVTSVATETALNGMISRAMLDLAICIRVNLWQKLIPDREVSMKSLAVSMYVEGEFVAQAMSIRDICDKIIHADSVTKDSPHKSIRNDSYVTVQLKGTHFGKNWVVDLALALFANTVLSLLDEIEGEAQQ